MTYTPLYIAAMETGLVQDRQEFILPNDAYPMLENAYVWRERIKRKQGYQLLGRLRRVLEAESLGVSAASPWTFTIYSQLAIPITGESNAQIEIGSVVITISGPIIFTDQGDGTLTSATLGNSGIIDYNTGSVTLIHTGGVGAATTITFNYYPGLPAMGLRSRELTNVNNEQLVAFDTKYAYRYLGGFQEFLPGTTWTGNDSDFFWSTNYWVDDSNRKIFWVTNASGTTGDPIRFTNGVAGTNWVDFAPQVRASGLLLTQCLAMIPFRNRLIAFNTLEGLTLAGSTAYTNRIRWAAIGNPFTTAVIGMIAMPNANAWRDDIPGQGGYLDIPTSESITAIGFVRDNLVVYCERSTWQLRYTGRSIQPFQIEKVNTELGADSTFSAVQFDTSLVGIGDKGIVECDSYKSSRIDIKIPDLVFYFNNDSNGPKRVHGIRDFQQRLAYWTYPFKPNDTPSDVYPNRRLVYNYENDSWAIFTDSLTCLGEYQPQTSRRWVDLPYPWEQQNYPWINRPSLFPSIVGGNQQGYVEFLDQQVTNDVSLTITGITGNDPNVTTITSPNHNLQSGQIIKITGILAGTDFEDLNDGIFMVAVLTVNTFDIYAYNPVQNAFTAPNVHATGTYTGGGQISIRDNFRIVSKKFNFVDQGQNIQLGYLDVLMDNTSDGAISLYVYQNYNNNAPVNILPENANSDLFFNQVVPTSNDSLVDSLKNWQRVYCPVRSNFITLEWTLNPSQMNGIEQEQEVQIDAQILWLRPAGNQLTAAF